MDIKKIDAVIDTIADVLESNIKQKGIEHCTESIKALAELLQARAYANKNSFVPKSSLAKNVMDETKTSA